MFITAPHYLLNDGMCTLYVRAQRVYLLCGMRILLTCCVRHAHATVNITISPIDIIATLLARWDMNGSGFPILLINIPNIYG